GSWGSSSGFVGFSGFFGFSGVSSSSCARSAPDETATRTQAAIRAALMANIILAGRVFSWTLARPRASCLRSRGIGEGRLLRGPGSPRARALGVRPPRARAGRSGRRREAPEPQRRRARHRALPARARDPGALRREGGLRPAHRRGLLPRGPLLRHEAHVRRDAPRPLEARRAPRRGDARSRREARAGARADP